MSLSEHPHHVSHIVEELRRYGVLQISLKFLDNNSRYLRQLLLGFHQNHGHRLPIAHSATCGWFVEQSSLPNDQGRLKVPRVSDQNSTRVYQGPQAAIPGWEGDLVTPLSEEAAGALKELNETLRNEGLVSTMALSLSSAKMAEGSILLVDNRRWLHSRTNIQDPMRHLRRVRWDAAPFHGST
ncbi:L-asparagine oxygenase [Apiospora arundinis]|uniref:L-asparagine oxygenase n=1 Tax=Apiospora arundinis TaxID=335852 RepID=A0ABR2I7N9_9PEZI